MCPPPALAHCGTASKGTGERKSPVVLPFMSEKMVKELSRSRSLFAFLAAVLVLGARVGVKEVKVLPLSSRLMAGPPSHPPNTHAEENGESEGTRLCARPNAGVNKARPRRRRELRRSPAVSRPECSRRVTVRVFVFVWRLDLDAVLNMAKGPRLSGGDSEVDSAVGVDGTSVAVAVVVAVASLLLRLRGVGVVCWAVKRTPRGPMWRMAGRRSAASSSASPTLRVTNLQTGPRGGEKREK